MKNSNLTLKAATYLILAAMLVWMGLYAWQAMSNPYRTVLVTELTDRQTVVVQGIVAREEQTLDSVYTSVHVNLEEGRRVSRGGVVAEAYDSGDALLRAVRLSELENRVAELESQLTTVESRSSQQTDTAVLEDIREMRAAAGRDSLSDAQSMVMLIQSRVFAASSTVSEISREIQSGKAEIAELTQRGVAGTASITAPVSGLYSSSTDGWEYLTPEELTYIRPSELMSLMRENHSPSVYSIGKIVSGNRWYYAAVLSAEDGNRITGKKSLLVYFGQYMGLELTMDVEWLSNAEDGQQTLLLSCDKCMTDVLTMRRQTAELVLTAEEGLRIPRKGLHVDEDGNACVYVQTGLRAEKKTVTVLRDYGDYYMVSSDSLRTGDEVIVSAKGLRDGKVVGE